MSERVVLPTDLVPSHYTLELTPSLDRLDFYCNEEIVVDVVKEVKEVTLHSRDIYVESVSFKSATSSKLYSLSVISVS